MKRLYPLICLLLFCGSLAHSQSRRPVKRSNSGIASVTKPGSDFLKKQFWLGFKAGTNLTQANVQDSYTVIVPPPGAITTGKEYKSFNLLGSQAALEVTFYTKGFSISLQPTYKHSRFEYSNHFEWMDSNIAENRLVLDYNQEQQTDHLEIPLLVKYDIAGSKLRPFVQAGIYYSILLNANKVVDVSGIDYASGGTNQYASESIIVGAEDLFANNYWGLLAGAGVNYNLGNVRLTFEGTYLMGMSLANSTENRYKNDRLAGVGDALDDFKLNNIAFSFGCLFPMRYLASGFKTLDR